MDIQFTSDDGTVKPGDTMYDWSQIFINAGETMGRTFKIAQQSKQLIQDAGFVDVVEKRYKVPVGGWMEDERWKEIGQWNAMYLLSGLEGMALYILKHVLNVSGVPPRLFCQRPLREHFLFPSPLPIVRLTHLDRPEKLAWVK